MTGNDDIFGMKIETSISFMIGRITKEDAWSGSGLEFASVVENKDIRKHEGGYRRGVSGRVCEMECHV